MENHFTEHTSSPKRQIYLSVKILIVAVAIFILLLVTSDISFYINVTSGGLKPVYGEIFLYCFWGSTLFILLFMILIPTCIIKSLIKIDSRVNIVSTVIAIIILVSISISNSYLWAKKIRLQSGPDLTRSVGINLGKGRKLREFGLKLNQLETEKDFIFTEQLLEPNFTRSIMNIPKGKFVLNSNLLNNKPSQIPDNVVVVFESNVPHDNGYIGGPNDVSTWWHYGHGSLMIFGDGRVEFVKTEDFNNLRWKP